MAKAMPKTVPGALVPLHKNANTPDTITVFRAFKLLNKLINGIDDDGSWRVQSYGNAKTFTAYCATHPNADKVYQLVLSLSRNPNFCLLYGKPTQSLLNKYTDIPDLGKLPTCLRRSSSQENEPATLEAGKTTMVIIDIENLILPRLTYNAKGAEKVRQYLVKNGVPELEGVSMIYQWTAKAGMRKNEA